MSAGLHRPTKAVVRWLENGTDQFLTQGDHETKSITFSAAFSAAFDAEADAEAAIFELAVPVKLKGLDTGTNTTLRICASTIASLELLKKLDIPLGMQDKLLKKLDIPPGTQDEFDSTVLGLDFTLKDPPAIILPIGAQEPLSGTRKRSRYVLDKIRELSKAMALRIYIEACNAPEELQDICNAVSEGRFTRCTIQHQIASMYGGIGETPIYPSDPALPPSYDEAAISPPPPPPIDRSRKKRALQDSDPGCDDDITLPLAKLRTLEQMLGRIETLEAESKKWMQKNTYLEEMCDALKNRLEDNESTNKELEDRLKKVESTNKELEDRLEKVESINKELEDHLEEVESTNEALEERLQERLEERLEKAESSDMDFKENYDLQLTDLRETMTEFEGIVQNVQDGQLTDESKEDLVKNTITEIMKRLANR